MATKIPYIGKKGLIRAELLKCAQAVSMEFPTCSDFGKRVCQGDVGAVGRSRIPIDRSRFRKT
jgi:hypothetical protein